MAVKEPIMDDWYKWAEMFNKFAAWATIGLAVLWWFLIGFSSWALFWSPISGLYYLITGVAGGVLYFIMVFKPVADKDQTKMTHIWLIVCTALAWHCVFIPLVFLFYSILSDEPFWEAFGE